MRFPATAPILIRRAPACAPESPKLSLLGAAPRRRANFSGVVADKQCTCLASKLMWERYPPTPPISTAGNSTNAQREAQAALERARGESAALRNLANGARVLEGNPALQNLRLMQSLTAAQNGGNTFVLGMPGGFVPLKQSTKLAGPDDREAT